MSPTVVCLLALSAGSWQAASPPDRLEPKECLAIRAVGQYGRSAVHTDAIEALIVSGKWAPPKAGDTITLPDGRRETWTTLAANKDGSFGAPGYAGGYAYFAVDSPKARPIVLEASGHGVAYVNGEPRAGDPYGYGYVRLPVLLKAGRNDILLQLGRGGCHMDLVAPPEPVTLDARDSTLPDFRIGDRVSAWGALVLINASTSPLTGARIESVRPNELGSAAAAVPTIPPMSARKIGFRLSGRAPSADGVEKVELRLHQAGRLLDSTTVSIRDRKPDSTYKVTFLSDIDGSVQYYAVNPPPSLIPHPSALFLTLHGAGVEAIGQADAYSPKSWGYLVAPPTRRPYGFDWEEWGRMDALEVLSLARKALPTDPARTYLTGHSMGGHGTWQVGVTFPDRFAAIGPSAGWISFQSYAGAPKLAGQDHVDEIMRRAVSPSDTLGLMHNYLNEGIYILHGGADDNVPVTEAREMVKRLGEFHHDFTYHEQPGVGHWWDASDEPGADCVDWAPMFDLFAHHRIPADSEVRQVEFSTADPGISSRCHWAEIQQEAHALQISSISLRCDPYQRRFSGTTTNVARLSLAVSHLAPGKPIKLELDGQKLEASWPAAAQISLARDSGGKWSVAGELSRSQKGPERYGPFKEAFRHRMVFVYGTRGTPEENAWAFAKARFDAETFWYRGNGSVEVVADSSFGPSKDRDRTVVLYGSSETNGAWNALLAGSPVQVKRGSVRIGTRRLIGDDLACLLVRPRPGSDVASVAVISGTGIAGMRLADRLPYFLSGVGYPDCTVIGPEMLQKGIQGIRAAGFFGNDWGVDSGDWAWR